mmetsp:Transcript_55317/g.109908  ORF Transcript_55317/g.109908 Transcript_55317/m.109908 type:complete len:269 (+) Transcript_55317:1480-2286(+)
MSGGTSILFARARLSMKSCCFCSCWSCHSLACNSVEHTLAVASASSRSRRCCISGAMPRSRHRSIRSSTLTRVTLWRTSQSACPQVARTPLSAVKELLLVSSSCGPDGLFFSSPKVPEPKPGELLPLRRTCSPCSAWASANRRCNCSMCCSRSSICILRHCSNCVIGSGAGTSFSASLSGVFSDSVGVDVVERPCSSTSVRSTRLSKYTSLSMWSRCNSLVCSAHCASARRCRACNSSTCEERCDNSISSSSTRACKRLPSALASSNA